MTARRAQSNTAKTVPPSSEWVQHLLLFSLFFAGLMLLHAPLLRLPYFWDEAGYYVPAARDLLLTGSLIPHSTPSNAHPPLVMAWLALVWRIFGFSTLVTRTAMVAVSAFTLVGLFRLSRIAANVSVACATVALVAVYPVCFMQSSMAQVDLAAAGLTFWGLADYILSFGEGVRGTGQAGVPWKPVLWFSLAALAKETAILAPLALFVWHFLAHFLRPRLKAKQIFPTGFPDDGNAWRFVYLLLPAIPLAGWYAYHYSKTGFLLGNPEFFRYNVAATLSPLRIPFALGMRLWQLLGYFGLYLLTFAGSLALLQSPRKDGSAVRRRIPLWIVAAFLSVILAYLAFMSAVGGAVLARYMLPAVPLMMLILVSTLWRRLRYWILIVAAVTIAFVAGWFTNPPYGFSLEDNLAYSDFIVLQVQASHFLALQYPKQRVLTAWPASDELSRPWIGYVREPFPVIRVEDFSLPQVDIAARVRNRFDIAMVFSTKYQPPHPFLEDWAWWQAIKERFFGYHRDLQPEDIAQRLGGTIAYQKELHGQWIAVIALPSRKEGK
jgi:Dolichyl-phosphate-mannose-protein mannosyltransferase